MTNYERIKNMNIEEIALAIVNGVSSDPCDYCKANEYSCNGYECEGYSKEDTLIIQEWLEREVDS